MDRDVASSYRLSAIGWRLAAVALLVTALNALKPLTIDDPIYLQYAQHIARHPADPYGFDIHAGFPATRTLAPPVFLYWWAGVIHSFGDHPVWWKLALFPCALLLAALVRHLALRLAGGLEWPIVLMLAFNPAYLPSWNLMLDMPALTLGLASLTLWLLAADRNSLPLSLLAGCLLGLAMETKYTAFVMLGVIAWHGLLYGRFRLAIVSLAVALVLFAAVESWLAQLYGHSHFLYHLGERSTRLVGKLRLVLPLLSCVGGVVGWLIPLALLAIGCSRQIQRLATLLVAVAPLLIALVPEDYQVWWRNHEGEIRMEMAGVLFGLCGLVLGACLLTLIRRVLGTRATSKQQDAEVRTAWFLMGWIALEVLGYFALSPFPAVRRVLGVPLPLTLLIGRIAIRNGLVQRGVGCAYFSAGLSVALGLLYQAVDCWDAMAPQRAAAEAVKWIRERDAMPRTWCVGLHAFPYHAEREGLMPLMAGSDVHMGDWLVWSEAWERATGTAPTQLPRLHRIALTDCLSLRTQLDYYSSGRPLRHHEGPRYVLHIARISPVQPVGEPREAADDQQNGDVTDARPAAVRGVLGPCRTGPGDCILALDQMAEHPAHEALLMHGIGPRGGEIAAANERWAFPLRGRQPGHDPLQPRPTLPERLHQSIQLAVCLHGVRPPIPIRWATIRLGEHQVIGKRGKQGIRDPANTLRQHLERPFSVEVRRQRERLTQEALPLRLWQAKEQLTATGELVQITKEREDGAMHLESFPKDEHEPSELRGRHVRPPIVLGDSLRDDGQDAVGRAVWPTRAGDQTAQVPEAAFHPLLLFGANGHSLR